MENIHDLHAVAILRGGDVVGHVPHMISTPCNVFIRQGYDDLHDLGSQTKCCEPGTGRF